MGGILHSITPSVKPAPVQRVQASDALWCQRDPEETLEPMTLPSRTPWAILRFTALQSRERQRLVRCQGPGRRVLFGGVHSKTRECPAYVSAVKHARKTLCRNRFVRFRRGIANGSVHFWRRFLRRPACLIVCYDVATVSQWRARLG